MLDYKLEHILSFTGIGANPPEVIGTLPEGTRVNFRNVGGEVRGDRIRGKLRAAGGDWVTVRKDGIAILDARVTFETDDGALILVTYPGLVDFGEDGHDKFLRADLPPAVPVRTSPRFFTGHPSYQWLTRLHCIGIGEYRPAASSVSYDVYAVR
ncbi:MAG: DUF3237 domain-containing protein [Vicinamibacterales bacterium]